MSRKRDFEKVLNSEYVTISELVQLTDNRYSTLKYYTEENMIPFIQEGEGLVRRYHRETSIERIDLIKYLKTKGLTIVEIKKKMNIK
ncbi:MerR family transcriptional regulator [Clostridium estertheticum]|uniref:MerR family transcriptional regulator n=1 Tax=Clostridium estertheticum TaxID=238834 RepID=A0A5N7J8B0_9CLOT|nr:helix-turn-helix domain-containing protein [Clostridium estertheticum]MPQ33928.1 MerR family transcriptional regulator [Clostridium estertheticum]MPQ64943.1 MerR family transcriptional regulator [Clostridium estertheticum]